jgi:glycosyltransferase involved in cell wall biosynthesis
MGNPRPAGGSMKRILFVTWDAPGATYLEGLFLPAFRRLAPLGYRFDVLQFGWAGHAEIQGVAARCDIAGVGYRHAPIDRRWGAVGPLKSAVAGGKAVRAAVRSFGSDWIMPRSLFAGLATLTAHRPQPILYECDGFAADERADFGGWGRGPRYWAFRAIEQRLARRAVVSTVRTDYARDELARRASIARERVFTVTNGRDPAHFHPLDPAIRAGKRDALGVAPSISLLVHAGSVGPQYQLDRLDPLFAALAERGASPRLLLLNGNPDAARQALGDCAPVAARDAIVRSAPAQEVGDWLALADAGLAFRAPSPSMRAVAPVKLSEYLLCGLPVVGSAIAGHPVEALEADLLCDQERGGSACAGWLVDKAADRDRVSPAAVALGRGRYGIDRMVADYAAALNAMSARVA